MTLLWFGVLGCEAEPEAPPATRTVYAGQPAWSARSAVNGVDAAVARWEANAPPGVRHAERGGAGLGHAVGPTGSSSGAGPSGAEWLPERVVPDAVGAIAVDRAKRNEDRGAALAAALDALPANRVSRYGLGALTPEQLFGTESEPGVCEMPGIEVPVDGPDGAYTARLAVYPYTALLGDPEPMYVSISAACVAGVADAAGDIEAAVADGSCADDEAHTFFAAGGACRACVEDNGGDYAACQDDTACPEQAALAVWVADGDGEPVWYRSIAAEVWACAPDWLMPFYLLADTGEDGDLPDTYDHDRWAFACTPFWDEEAADSVMACMGGFEPGDRGVLAEGLFGFVEGIAPKGDDTPGWRGREYYVDSVTFTEGAEVRWWWASMPGLASLSAPNVIADTDGDGSVGPGDEDYGFGSGGFGLDPHGTRPDGESLARDWLATMTMKVSTTEDGLPIIVSQRSRCADDAWTGPDAEGAWRCGRMGAPEGGWLNDVYVPWADTGKTQTGGFPVVTLGSTGLLDADVPGGVVVHLASSTSLAAAGWDACELPHTFVPDLAPMEDVPLDYGGLAGLDAETWRFGAPDREDFRVVLGTNRARGWCGAGADGEGRSALDALE